MTLLHIAPSKRPKYEAASGVPVGPVDVALVIAVAAVFANVAAVPRATAGTVPVAAVAVAVLDPTADPDSGRRSSDRNSGGLLLVVLAPLLPLTTLKASVRHAIVSSMQHRLPWSRETPKRTPTSRFTSNSGGLEVRTREFLQPPGSCKS